MNTEFKIAASPITGTIYAGRVDLNKAMWVGNKIDVSDMAVDAVATYLAHRDMQMQFTHKGETYILAVHKL